MPKETLAKAYDPKPVEPRQVERWLERDHFRAEQRPGRKPFAIVIPPPNLTGALHMGHALDETVQDVIIRYKRMRGYDALWLPGTDHASIATQNVVEKNLADQGLTRYDLGRERFLEEAWRWKEEAHTLITDQLKRLGSSLDWSRERFTMDEALSYAVRLAFVKFYEEGYIYRAHRIINWCPRCATALSDIEVEHVETSGRLYHITYPLKEGSGAVTVATTRPETMLGDTAVAAHPEDERYRHLVGKTVILPLMEREIPVIADGRVQMDFGTGAVKVTPAHDPDDFEIGETHGLPKVTVIGTDARMTSDAGRYAGLERYECREQVLKDLEAQGLLVKVEGHSHSVGHCSRCDSVVEPLISLQWFMRMKDLAQAASAAARSGQVQFIPERWTKVYCDWLDNIRDWCISRQLWWGHQIPVWYCDSCGDQNASMQDLAACPECGSTNIRQDPDVLDTWFSSALWPFSTMGWPEDTPDMRYFYPTSVLVTGYDIIFFWVARMVMFALKLTGQVPFYQVLIHGLVRDERGRKMSKSEGNVVDPLELVERYGADAMRFALTSSCGQGQDITLSPARMVGARNLCNKLWNVARFVLMNSEEEQFPGEAPRPASLADRWILSRCQQAIQSVTAALEDYNLDQAATIAYEFLWGEFCDWYVELAKPQLASRETRHHALETLHFVLRVALKLLHPVMPFITEEIWLRLREHCPGEAESIVIAGWPRRSEELLDPQAESEMTLVMDVTGAVRNLRAELGLSPTEKVEVSVFCDESVREILAQAADYPKVLARIDSLIPKPLSEERPDRAISSALPQAEVFLHVDERVDLGQELARLEKSLAKMEKQLGESHRLLSDPQFLAKAKSELVERERARAQELTQAIQQVRERMALFERMA